MARKRQPQGRGHFGIGVYQVKTVENVGMLWRGAYQLGASYIFTIGARYNPQRTDVFKTWRTVPLFNYENMAQMVETSAYSCPVIGIEQGGTPLQEFTHPERAVYLLGAEESGLPKEMIARCHRIVSIPAVRSDSYNVAMAGTLVMYDRFVKT